MVGGWTGDVIAIALITLRLGAVVRLFLEVGLSEEWQVAREDKRRRHVPATESGGFGLAAGGGGPATYRPDRLALWNAFCCSREAA